MKKIFLGVLVLLVLSFSYSFSSIESSKSIANTVSVENSNCNYGQCQATAKSTGQRCKHCVSNSGDLYCWQHIKK